MAIEGSRFRTMGDSVVYRGRFSTADGLAEGIIFASSKMMGYFAVADEIHADGSFYIVPGFFYQLLTIGFFKGGYVSIICDHEL